MKTFIILLISTLLLAIGIAFIPILNIGGTTPEVTPETQTVDTPVYGLYRLYYNEGDPIVGWDTTIG